MPRAALGSDLGDDVPWWYCCGDDCIAPPPNIPLPAAADGRPGPEALRSGVPGGCCSGGSGGTGGGPSFEAAPGPESDGDGSGETARMVFWGFIERGNAVRRLGFDALCTTPLLPALPLLWPESAVPGGIVV